MSAAAPATGVEKNSLIPKSIAVTKTHELIGDNFPEGGADAPAENMILGKAANPKIDRIDISVEREQLRLKIGIARNLTETRDARQSIGDARAYYNPRARDRVRAEY